MEERKEFGGVMETCPTCDGTGEVHSHNPKCWECNGKGVVGWKADEMLLEEIALLRQRIDQLEREKRGIGPDDQYA
jgi:DnaJ-class molecular chaperone